jgi:hypothetical protein
MQALSFKSKTTWRRRSSGGDQREVSIYLSRYPATNATSAMITVTLGTLDDASSSWGAGAWVEDPG